MYLFQKNHAYLLGLLSSLTLFGVQTPTPTKSPQEVLTELRQAEEDFEIAQEMFIPWYTGPLITGSSKNAPKGHVNVQPYLFLKGSYGAYGDDRSFINTTNTFTVNPLLVFQRGLTSWLDVTLQPQASFRYQNGSQGASFNDLGLSFGFQLYKESLYIPGIRFVYTETFPTGSFTSLENGLDGVGAGVFQSTLGLNLGKVLWWFPLHPMALRLTTNVQLPTNQAPVDGLNSYGGGAGTLGRVKVRPTFNIDFGYEISLTQKWVVALDIAYSLSGSATFSGTPGIDPVTRLPYILGQPVSDSLTLAPAIEYNVTDSGGFIAGVWFSVTGRNTASFCSGILSYTELF